MKVSPFRRMHHGVIYPYIFIFVRCLSSGFLYSPQFTSFYVYHLLAFFILSFSHYFSVSCNFSILVSYELFLLLGFFSSSVGSVSFWLPNKNLFEQFLQQNLLFLLDISSVGQWLFQIGNNTILFTINHNITQKKKKKENTFKAKTNVSILNEMFELWLIKAWSLIPIKASF